MSWATALLSLLNALPEILGLIKQFMVWLNHVTGNDPQGFIKSLGQAMAQLNAAQTKEERIAAAKSIADTLSHLP